MTLDFTDDAIDALADAGGARSTRAVENIGARRLHTVMERLLEEISFTATDRAGETVSDRRAPMSTTRSARLAKNADLSKFIL